MYNLLISRFKAALTDRNVELKLIIIFSIILLISLCVIAINAVMWQIWFLYALSIVFVLVAGLISAHCVIFTATKKKFNYRLKDFFRFKTVWKNVNRAQEKDSIILLTFINEIGICTTTKAEEALRHFQMLLSIKQHKGSDISTIVSVALSVISLVICGITFGDGIGVTFLLILSFSSIAFTIVICFAIKFFYKSVFYSVSEYAIYERIEMALSEICIKELLMQ